tara:strand:+ start:138 stop:416 length:279 start_codon:yes stop_codon:yes gene_type:complete
LGYSNQYDPNIPQDPHLKTVGPLLFLFYIIAEGVDADLALQTLHQYEIDERLHEKWHQKPIAQSSRQHQGYQNFQVEHNEHRNDDEAGLCHD